MSGNTIQDEGRYAAAPPRVTLEILDDRLRNVEVILLQLQAQMTPKWVRVGGWTTIAGAILGAALKYLAEGR